MDYLNKKNCKKLTGLSFENILSLSGIYGVHTDLELENVIYFQAEVIGNVVTIEFETDLLKEFIINIYLESKLIKIDKFYSTKIKEGISFPFLVCQIDKAMALNFKAIYLHAYGNHKTIKTESGFLVWGLYGFQIANKRDKLRFKGIMNNLVPPHNSSSLSKLLSTKSGIKIWAENGEEWYGVFDLSPASTSMKIFKKVRKQKKL